MQEDKTQNGWYNQVQAENGNDDGKRTPGNGRIIEDHDSRPPDPDQTTVENIFIPYHRNLGITQVNKQADDSDPEFGDQEQSGREVLADQFYRKGIEADQDHGKQRHRQIIHLSDSLLFFMAKYFGPVFSPRTSQEYSSEDHGGTPDLHSGHSLLQKRDGAENGGYGHEVLVKDRAQGADPHNPEKMESPELRGAQGSKSLRGFMASHAPYGVHGGESGIRTRGTP